MNSKYIDKFVIDILEKSNSIGLIYCLLGGFSNGKVDLFKSSDIDIIFKYEKDLLSFLQIIDDHIIKYTKIIVVLKRKTSSGFQLVLSSNNQVFMFDLMTDIRFYNFRIMDTHIFFDLINAGFDATAITKFVKNRTGFKAAWPKIPPLIYSFKLYEVSRLAKVTYFLLKSKELISSLVTHKTGLFVVVLGPDGCGKTAVIEKIMDTLCGQRTIIPVFRFHWRVFLFASKKPLQIVTNPHEKVPRNIIMSLVKLCYLWLIFNLGYWFKLFRLVHRGCIVLFDRYYLDLLVDSRRYRYQGPLWLAHFVGRYIPQPDLILLLDAPAEVLQSRKQEVPFEESERQRDAYLALVKQFPKKLVIDASRPLEEVYTKAAEAILNALSQQNVKQVTK
jgi:thymidylate kinase